MSNDVAKELEDWGNQYEGLDYGQVMLEGAKEIKRLRELADEHRKRGQLQLAATYALGDELEKVERELKAWRELAYWQHNPDSSKCDNYRTCDCVELDYEVIIELQREAVNDTK